jgi:hypothetical protein
MTSRQPDADYPSRAAPVALLLLVVAIGLLGAIPHVAWSGPLHSQGEVTVVGIVLEAALAGLLVAVFTRGSDGTDTARKLRTGLKFLLSAGMVALFVFLLVNAHLHLPANGHTRPSPTFAPPAGNPRQSKGGGGHLPGWLLFVLIGVVLIALVVLASRLAIRLRRPPSRVPRRGLAVDPDDLKTALDEGAAALRAADYDDARKAIIACYLAMEQRLGDKNDADTPDELLARATSAGLIRGPAASTLTGLFYEARFSSHPLGGDKRDAAIAALDELRGQT